MISQYFSYDFRVLQSMVLSVWSKLRAALIFNLVDIGFILARMLLKHMEIANDLYQYKLEVSKS